MTWTIQDISEPNYSEHPEDPADWEATLEHPEHGAIFITAPGTLTEENHVVPWTEALFTECIEAMLAGLNLKQ